MVTKPSLDAIRPGCRPEEIKDSDVIGVGQTLVSPIPQDNSNVASDLAVKGTGCTEWDFSQSAGEQLDVVTQVGDCMRYGSIDEGCDLADNRKSPPQLTTGTDATSATRPPEARACPFSIESLLERRRTSPSSEHRPNDAPRSRNRTCKRTEQLQFQPVGFQVERLSPSTIPESASASTLNILTAN